MSQFLNGGEVAHPEELFLQGAKEPFDAPVAFRLADERGRRCHAEEDDLRVEVGAQIDAAVMVAQRQAGGGGRRQAAKVVADAWRIGSSASKRSPRVAAWMPTHSAVQ